MQYTVRLLDSPQKWITAGDARKKLLVDFEEVTEGH
jgi:hypothetical protein